MELPQQTLETVFTDLTETSPSPASADEADIAHFERSMQSAETSSEGIFNGVVRSACEFVQDVSSAQEKMEAGLQKEITNPNELLARQHEVFKVHMIFDITAKVAGRCTQSLETLQKIQ